MKPEPRFRFLPRNLAALVALACLGWSFAYTFSQETPVGTVHGRIVLSENQQPLGGADVILDPVTTAGKDSPWHTRYAVSAEDGAFSLAHVAAGTYHLSASSHAHAAKDITIDVEEGKTEQITVALDRSLDEFAMKEHQRVFGTREKPHLAVTGYVDSHKPPRGDTMRLRLFKTRLSRVLQNPASSQALESVGRDYDPAPDLPDALLHPADAAAPRLIDTRDIPLTEADKEGFFYQNVNFGALPTGLYLLDLTHSGKTLSAWLLVTDTALVAKRAQGPGPTGQVVAYAVDMQSGTPVPNSTVSAYRNGRIVAQGRTDRRGVAELAVPRASARRSSSTDEEGDGSSGDTGADSTPVTLVAVRGEDEAVVNRDEFRNEDGDLFALHAYTDRPIYRPGQRIYFKGILRRNLEQEGAGQPRAPLSRYAVPSGEPVRVEIRDPSGERILNQALTTNPYGSFFGQVDLDPQAPTGVYSLITTVRGEKHTHDIVIASYQKPEFAVSVTPAKARYIRGDTVTMTVSAQYYFGAPVAGAKLKYSVYSSPDYAGEYADASDNTDDADTNDPGDRVLYHNEGESYYGGAVVDGETMLDEDGKATLTFPAKGPEDAEGPASEVYTASVTVVEGEDREVTADGQVNVVSGDFRLSVRPEGYIATPDQPANVTVTARDYDGHPVPNVPIDLETGYHVWKRDEDGDYNYQYLAASGSQIITGADGKVTLPITPPRPGELYLKARAFDGHRHKILGRAYLWVTDDKGGDLDTEYADLSLLTDKRHYNPGETARVVINAQRTGQTVLLTVEGEKVYQAQTLAMAHHTAVLYVPVKAEYGPNVFLSACYVRDKHFATSETALRVVMPAQKITVAIRADRDTQHTTPTKSPSPLEGEGRGGVNAQRPTPNAAPKALTLAKYQPGDQITYTIRTTDPSGRPVPCELSFGVVDEAIYALKEDDPTALRDAFYPRRVNHVSTQYSFAIQYLGDADKAEPQIATRKKFPDTAHWEPVLHTDARGLATVSFLLPDNLTTWRATAVAHTLDTRLGRGTEQVMVAKDFLVRLETPRFLTQHDQARIVAIVHNDTGTTQTARVHLQAENLAVAGAPIQTFAVEAGKTAEAIWPVTAEGYGEAKVTVKAWTNPNARGARYTDGMETALSIRPHGRESIVAFSGELTAANPETEVLRLDPNAVPGLSHLTVRITPSVSGALVGAMDYLIGFPYGCTEQTMSRFLPDLLVQRTLHLRGMPDIPQSAQLPRMVHEGLLRLYRFQHKESGGWGWWEHDADDPWMTAYVLYGLSVARAQAYPVSDKVLARGRAAGLKMAKDAHTSPDNQAFLLYAIALAGDPGGAWQERSHVRLDLLHSEAFAYLVLLDKLEGHSSPTVQAELDRRAVSADGMLHWRAYDKDNYWDWDDQEATAVGLRALLAVNPNDPRIGAVLRWLMLKRTGSYWSSTRDTSWVLAAFCDYLAAQENFSPGGDVVVKLNGSAIQTYALTPDLQREAEITLRVPAAQMRPEKNDVTLERTGGTSPVFYSVELRQTVAMEDIPAIATMLTADLEGNPTRPASTAASAHPQRLEVTREYLRVLPRKNKDTDSWSLDTEPTNNRLQQGDRIRVRLTIHAPRDMAYVLIEDPFPAGCTVTERADAEEVVEWGYWWSSIDVRDDRIAFFARTLSKGDNIIEYNLRAQTPGSYHALPTFLQAMYSPEMRAESAEARVEIK